MMHRLEPERLMRILGHDRKGQQLRMAGKGHNRRWNGQTGKFDGLCPLSGCDCAPNPLLISANVRETHLVGPSATRLRSFADTQRNSSGERYGTIIPALESEVHAMLKASCRRAGYPERDVATLKITSMAFLENAPEVKPSYDPANDPDGSRLRGGGATGISRPATRAQAGHVDGGRGTVQAIVAMRDGTAPTRVFTGEHVSEEYVAERARRSPEEQRAFEAYQASDPHLPSHFKGCSPLALPRDELDGRLKPASDRLLNAGDAVVLFGDVIHGAPAVPAGVWRLVLFVSAYMSSITDRPYDIDLQTTPWNFAADLRSSHLLVEQCAAYPELDPLSNFSSAQDARAVGQLRRELGKLKGKSQEERARDEQEEGLQWARKRRRGAVGAAGEQGIGAAEHGGGASSAAAAAAAAKTAAIIEKAEIIAHDWIVGSAAGSRQQQAAPAS